MIKRLDIKMYIIILIVGEIAIVFAEILNGMNTEEIIPFIIGYFGIVTLFSFVSIIIDSIIEACRRMY